MRRTYLTVPEELLAAADAVGDYLAARGFTVGVEKYDVAYPYAPTFRAKKAGPAVTLFVEVDGRIPLERMRRWAAYGRSGRGDTRACLAIPATATMKAADQQALRELGVGLLVVDGMTVTELITTTDLALNVQLPDMRGAPARLRALMSEPHDKFRRGDWRDGFKDACSALEQEAATYLAKGAASGRIIVLTEQGRVRKLTAANIDRMTMGQLREAFSRIQNQNHVDAIIHSALERVLDDRNTATHPKKHARKLARVRANVGGHMWTIDNALRAVCDAD